MKLNDPARDAREAQGDFSEIDAYIKQQHLMQAVVAFGIVLCVVLAVLL